MEKVELGLTLSTLADITSTKLLWSVFGMVVIFTFMITLVFFYHWYNFVINKRLALAVGIIYTIGTLFFLSGMTLLINSFAGL